MKIAWINTEIAPCGGIIVPLEYIREMRKRGIDSFMVADPPSGDSEYRRHLMSSYMDIPIRGYDALDSFEDDDAIITIRWELCERLNGYKGKKYQFVQADDISLIGENAEMEKWRNDAGWTLIGVSLYALKPWQRGFVVPNGIPDRFFTWNVPERDIDVLVEGSYEPNKNIDRAIEEAKKLGGRIVWLGRETKPVEGVENITNPSQELIPGIYKRSKNFIKLSKSEGFCLPILEAMASGCLVYTWDMGGNDFCEYGINCIHVDNIGVPVDGKMRERIIRAGEETASEYRYDTSTSMLLSILR